MTTRTRLLPLLAAALAADQAAGQLPEAKPHTGRRDRDTPGLVLETGARTAACDALLFADKGRTLLATGDDKVVRAWAVGPNGALSPSADWMTLRWPIFRESRGNIYAMAVSPDGRRVLVAGQGNMAMNFAAAVIDRATGKIEAGINQPDDKLPDQGTIWSAAFSPSGERVVLGTHIGAVWVWMPKTGQCRLAGTHPVQTAGDEWFKLVRMVAFDPTDKTETTVVSICGTGEMRRWDGKVAGGKRLQTFAAKITNPAVLSPDGKWVGVVPEVPKGAAGYVVEVVSFPDGAEKLTYPIPDLPAVAAAGAQEIPHRVAFSPSGKYMAVALRKVNRGDGPVKFLQERSGRVILFEPALGVEQAPKDGPTQGLYAEQMAFHPTNENWLAVAGGDNHDVVLWDWTTGKKLGEVEQPGRSLWGVAVSRDGSQVAFQEKRDPAAAHPNRRGTGPWRYFDLTTRQYLPGAPFQPTPPLETVNGWTVSTVDENGRASAFWTLEKGGKRFPLKWHRDVDELPRCYAFLPPQEGRPDRLVIGHYWGASVYELTDTGPVRTRWLRGHDGYVTALAVAATDKGVRLITASKDMTLAGWDLDDWRLPGAANLIPRLGVELIKDGGKLYVGATAPGSPAWEMGMDRGDELIGIRAGVKKGNKLDDLVKYLVTPIRHDGKNLPPTEAAGKVNPEKALAYLKSVDGDYAPNNQQIFYWTSKTAPGKVFAGTTTLVERPLWKFFPHDSAEWVLWRVRDYSYDCSIKGDAHIGWQRSYPFDPNGNHRTPEFITADKLKGQFLRPDNLEKTLKHWQTEQALIAFNEIEPPEVTVSEPKRVDGKYRVAVKATARGDQRNQLPEDVYVWVNDYLLKVWEKVTPDGKTFTAEVDVPPDVLRVGRNLVTGQCYAVGKSRSDSIPRAIDKDPPAKPAKPTIHVLMVGVGNYKDSRPRQVPLNAATDARLLARELARRAKTPNDLFGAVKVTTLLDEEVSKQSVLQALENHQRLVKPDDLFIFYLGGHGTSQAELLRLGIDSGGVGRFVFLCGNYNRDRVPQTTINFEDLQDRLARLTCRKLVLLDACHSGEARTAGGDTDANPVRVLNRHGLGSIILAACQPDQQALEASGVDEHSTGMYGVFTIALWQLLASVGEKYPDEADLNRNGHLEAIEAARALEKRVNHLVGLLNAGRKDATPLRQDAVWVVPRLEEQIPVAVVR